MSFVENIVSAVSPLVPCTRQAWPEGSAPDLPWAVVVFMGRDGFYADDSVYAPMEKWCVELYQRVHDETLEDAVETAVEGAFGPVRRGPDQWIDDENCSVLPFYFTAAE